MGDTMKDKLEETLHRRFLWHEYADKGEYVSGGMFKDADPIEIMSIWAPSMHSRSSYVKCAGSKDMIPIEKFEDGNMCLHCRERALPGLLAWRASNESRHFIWDLTSSNAASGVASQVCVPAGCPHATSKRESSSSAKNPLLDEYNEEKYIASSVICTEHERYAVPYSWKIVKKQDKLTLSIQYRLRYFSQQKMGTVQHSMYCHVCCNLENGQTHISDLHSQETGRKSTGIYKMPMETITFTGTSELLQYMPQSQDLLPAFTALYDALKQELSQRGFECCSSVLCLPNSWSANVSADPYRDIRETVYSIALLNRFPNLKCFPLLPEVRETVALYIKRKFDKLPRDVSASTLVDVLKLPHTPALMSYIEEHPDYAFIPVMLDEWGFPDKDIERMAENGFEDVYDIFNKLQITKQTKHQRTWQPFDMLSIVAPALLVNEQEPVCWSVVLKMISKVIGGNADDIMRSIENEICVTEKSVSFRKFKKKWNTRYPSGGFRWERPDCGCQARAEISSDTEKIENIDLLGTWYLDRRTWNKKEARRYVSWLKEHPLEDIDISNPSLKISEEHKHISDTILRATRFSFTAFGLPHRKYDQKEVRLFYEWAYRNDIEVNLRLDNTVFAQGHMGAKARKGIEKRIEKNRKAKRDAKAEK